MLVSCDNTVIFWRPSSCNGGFCWWYLLGIYVYNIKYTYPCVKSLPTQQPNYALYTIKYLTYPLNGQIGLSTLFLQPYLPVHRTHPVLYDAELNTHTLYYKLNAKLFLLQYRHHSENTQQPWQQLRMLHFFFPLSMYLPGKTNINYGNHSWCSALSLPLSYTSQRTYTVTIATTVTIKEWL